MINTKILNEIHQLKKIAVFESIDSTNMMGISMAKAGMSDFIVIAEEQLNGRGRFKREWVSSKGGAYFSLGIDISDMSKPQLLTFVCANAIMKMLMSFNIESQFKWPNDVFVNGLKISGVLIELVQNIAVCGIGINVNNALDSLNNKAVSMNQINNEFTQIEYVIKHTVNNIYNLLSNNSTLSDFIENNPMSGKDVSIKTVSGIYSGRVEKLTDEGAIVIRTENGLKEFFEGDLSLEDK